MGIKKSIWYYRILKLVVLEIPKEGEMREVLIKRIKKIRTTLDNYPQEFTYKKFKDGKLIRQWYSKILLIQFIDIAINIGIFEEKKNSKIIKSLSGEKLYILIKNKKYSEISQILLELCENSLLNNFKIKIDDLIERIDYVTSPRTAYNIAIKLELSIKDPKEFFIILLKVILQIFGDISDKLYWTGKVTFGKNPELPNEIKTTVDKIVESEDKKKEMKRRIREDINDLFIEYAEKYMEEKWNRKKKKREEKKKDQNLF